MAGMHPPWRVDAEGYGFYGVVQIVEWISPGDLALANLFTVHCIHPIHADLVDYTMSGVAFVYVINVLCTYIFEWKSGTHRNHFRQPSRLCCHGVDASTMAG